MSKWNFCEKMGEEIEKGKADNCRTLVNIPSVSKNALHDSLERQRLGAVVAVIRISQCERHYWT